MGVNLALHAHKVTCKDRTWEMTFRGSKSPTVPVRTWSSCSVAPAFQFLVPIALRSERSFQRRLQVLKGSDYERKKIDFFTRQMTHSPSAAGIICALVSTLITARCFFLLVNNDDVYGEFPKVVILF